MDNEKLNRSIFSNFNDFRKTSRKELNEIILKESSKFETGEGVMLFLSKKDFGKISMALDAMGAEVIF